MTLRLGSTGEKVREVQKFLGLSPDGVFGKVTEASVKKMAIKQ